MGEVNLCLQTVVLCAGLALRSVAAAGASPQPLAGLTDEQVKAFERGREVFEAKWIPAPGPAGSRDGLGPFFHANSCAACHPGGGRGPMPGAGIGMPALLFRPGLEGEEDVPDYGTQLAPLAVPGVKPEGQVDIAWKPEPVRLADGTSVEMQRPIVIPKEWNYAPPPAGLRLSGRLGNALFGDGLLAAIPVKAIMAQADPEDKNADGISGRPNEESTWDGARPAEFIPSRFGWKAAMPTLRRQVSAALAQDMGLTNSFHPMAGTEGPELDDPPRGGHGEGLEASDADVRALVAFVRYLAPPEPRGQTTEEATRGRETFSRLGCAACHTPEWTTGQVAGVPALSGKTIHPFTDLLLHDMGEDLADHRPEAGATGVEWRTAPLWGLGADAAPRLLHDGRARTVQEAILWHGGEAKSARDAFTRLPAVDRAALLSYLGTL